MTDFKYVNGELVELTPEEIEEKNRPPAPEEIQAERLRDIKEEMQRRIDKGSAFAVRGVVDPIPVPGVQPYREIINAKLTASQGFAAQGVTDPIVLFRDGNNINHMLTPQQMIALCIQSMRYYEGVNKVYWDMKDGVGDFASGIPADFSNDEYWP